MTTKIMYHGSPSKDLSFKGFRGITFFTENPKVAAMYAKGDVFKTGKTAGTGPTVFVVQVALGKILDLRKPADQQLYERSRKTFNGMQSDPDDMLPTLKSIGFIMSNTGLPSFGYVRAMFQAIKGIDTIIVDDGQSGITFGVYCTPSMYKVVNTIPVT